MAAGGGVTLILLTCLVLYTAILVRRKCLRNKDRTGKDGGMKFDNSLFTSGKNVVTDDFEEI